MNDEIAMREMTRTEKVKNHFRKHKVAYSCGATAVVVAGITCVIMRSNSGRCAYSALSDDVVQTVPSQVTSQSFNTNSFNTTNNHFDQVKRLSYIVRDPETERWWTSQYDVAKDLGTSASNVSKFPNHGEPIPGYPDLNLVREGVRSAT